MRLLLAGLLVARGAWAQCTAGYDPLLGKIVCPPSASAGLPGSGTVTSVGLAGTANQITVTGSSPITTSGSWTLSLPSAITLPGSLTVPNGSSISATGSGTISATDSTKINGVALTLTPAAGMTPISTGSTTSTWQQQTYSVVAFGATGNGSTDDTAAIAAALIAASSGGIVYFPNGTYITTGTTVSTANTTIQLSSGATLKLKASTVAAVLTITANYVTVTGGVIDGNSGSQSGTTGHQGILIDAIGTSQVLQGVVVKGVIVQNTLNQGILVQQSGSGASTIKCTLMNNTIINTGNASVAAVAEGIALYGPSYIQVQGNIITTTANHGIVSTRGSFNQILGNRVVNAGANRNTGFAHGIAVDGNGGSNRNTNHLVNDNYVENSYDKGIECADGVDHITISDNIVNGTGANSTGGIYFGGGLAFSEYGSIVGNQVMNVGGTGSGIEVSGPDTSHRSAHATVTGNVVYASARHGIYVHFADEGTVSANVVMNNSASSSGTYNGLQLDTYDRWTVTGNRFADNQGGSATQGYGINFANTPGDNVVASGNTVEPNKTGTILLPGGTNGATNIRTSRNQGYNPTNATATPSVPSTGSVITNNTGYDVMVFVSTNSAGTQILIGGTSGVHNVANLPSGFAYAFHLPVGQTAGFIYSGAAPGWQWIGE